MAETPSPPSQSSSNLTIIVAVSATAACTLILAGLFFWLFQKYITNRRGHFSRVNASFHREDVETHEEFKKLGKNVKGIIIRENGMDVLYMRKLEDSHGQLDNCFPRVVLNPSYEDDKEEKVDTALDKPKISTSSEISLLQEQLNAPAVNQDTKPSSSNPSSVPLVQHQPSQKAATTNPQNPTATADQSLTSLKEASPQARAKTPMPLPLSHPPCTLPPQRSLPPPPSSPSPSPYPPPPPPPPPPSPPRSPLTPPPPQSPPPPPLRHASPTRKHNLTATTQFPMYTLPPPPEAGVQVSPLRPQSAPRGKASMISKHESTQNGSKANDYGHMKLKQLHWEKVLPTNADHSVVWDAIQDGSLRFDDEMMETLFGYSNRHSNYLNKGSSDILSSSNRSSPTPTSQMFIFEPRKSQNTAIILRSLGVSREEILDALLTGQGLGIDTLEKLVKIRPTQQEATKILQFNDNPAKLADAESFLHHILKAIPSAFSRFDAMLFRLNYDLEILHLKETLQTLELGCKELRTQGLFLKLLEAILKAGNRMNAGTARGNALGFDLHALGKLSDVKSTDGKTTLLHFVVEQVARSEGRRQMVVACKDFSGSGNSHGSKPISLDAYNLSAHEKDEEYLRLGLQELERLIMEFFNARKAAAIDQGTLLSTCASLSNRVAEIRQLTRSYDNGERGGFVREMKKFLGACDEELAVVSDEQARVLELVKRTTSYYQLGASKEKGQHQLQLFILVRDFLDMVDRVRAETSQRLQKKNVRINAGSSPPPSPPPNMQMKFTKLFSHLASERLMITSSSESDDEFQ